eukprot:7531890-Alexandrium_andersonii.AAC.1
MSRGLGATRRPRRLSRLGSTRSTGSGAGPAPQRRTPPSHKRQIRRGPAARTPRRPRRPRRCQDPL